MKSCLLLILAVILLLAVVYGLYTLSPLLTAAVTPAPANAPAEGFDILFRLFGWKK